jgi:hypothetical protein
MMGRLKRIIHFLLQPLRLLGAWLDRELMGAPIAEQPPLIRNEILKLRAQSVDRLSTACFSLGAAGALAPVVARSFAAAICRALNVSRLNATALSRCNASHHRSRPAMRAGRCRMLSALHFPSPFG